MFDKFPDNAQEEAEYPDESKDSQENKGRNIGSFRIRIVGDKDQVNKPQTKEYGW